MVKVIVYLNKYRISYMVIQTIMLKCIIRATAVRFLSDNPDWFIESIVGTSWNQYLYNMSHQGTCILIGLITLLYIQAISDSMQWKINIVESSQNFRETTIKKIIEPTLGSDAENIQSVQIGHIHVREMHYVSIHMSGLLFTKFYWYKTWKIEWAHSIIAKK